MDCQALNTSTCPPNSVKLVSVPRPGPQGCPVRLLPRIKAGKRGCEAQLDPEAQPLSAPLRVGVLDPERCEVSGPVLPGKGGQLRTHTC